MWTVLLTLEVKEWLDDLAEHDSISHRLVVQAVDVLADEGPALGRPLVDRVKGSRLHNLKELRPGSTGRTEIRILFAFDPWRRAVLLVAGDEAGSWSQWYRREVPRAERLFLEFCDSEMDGGS